MRESHHSPQNKYIRKLKELILHEKRNQNKSDTIRKNPYDQTNSYILKNKRPTLVQILESQQVPSQSHPPIVPSSSPSSQLL